MAGFATPPLPTTTTEFITALAHYHRAEIARMAGWRDRIDRTTNWAITGVAAMLSLSLSTPSAHHGVLLFAMLLVMLLLLIEARRYQFFDVYRGRVRLIERNYFAQMFDPESELDRNWARTLGEDLRAPKFLMSLRAAMSRRLRRNYFWMFSILLLAWVLKITSPQAPGSRGATRSSQRRCMRLSAMPISARSRSGRTCRGGAFSMPGYTYVDLPDDGTARRTVHGKVHVAGSNRFSVHGCESKR